MRNNSRICVIRFDRNKSKDKPLNKNIGIDMNSASHHFKLMVVLIYPINSCCKRYAHVQYNTGTCHEEKCQRVVTIWAMLDE